LKRPFDFLIDADHAVNVVAMYRETRKASQTRLQRTMIEIEYEEPETSVCECCGGATTSLTRFVSQDNDAFAVYYAAFSSNHPEKGLTGVVNLGEWWEDEVPESRVAFVFEMWPDDNNYNVGIINANESDWADVNIIGRKLSRNEALEHPWLNEVFHITDHMTADDPEIIAFFNDEAIQ